MTSTNSTIDIKAAAASDTMPALNTWNYQTFVRDVKSAEQANLQWYFNGAADGSKSEDNPQPVNNGHATLVLGGGKGPRVFPGSIDEVRVSNVARSADWVKASHDTVMGSPFATYGSARENVDKGMIIILK